ncbi:MAG: response regulator [Magnetococcales bacterium]|nr:response regulator [Magnetococcales bacterium]MBF0113900.1 response regulator [Magnetococcales bacterium]
MSEPGRFNVLIVDDDPAVLAEYRFLLAKEGFKVFQAQNRADTLPYIEQFRLDKRKPPEDIAQILALAIVDQNLKDPDPRKYERDYSAAGGIPLITQLRAASPPTRILVCTAFKGTPADEGFAAARAGADAYLGKGDPALLLDRVRKELEFFESQYNRMINKSL